MTHYSEDDLILHYYGEDGRRRGPIADHLETCAECGAAYRALATVLQALPASEPPERGDQYGLEVWQRIRHQLPEPAAPGWAAWLGWRQAGLAAAAASLVVAAFLAGRLSPRPASPARPVAADARGAAADASTRIRDAAISDHLERSERVLLDLMNARGPDADVHTEQAWAGDLINSNRLYRDAALRAGDTAVAGVLDELERSLLEIVHGPSTLTPAELQALRTRLDAAALLFKVRVLHDELRGREIAPAPARPRRTT